MSDLFMLAIIPVCIFSIYLIGLIFDAIHECWHKWDKWIVWQTEDAYCQGRKCSKCGRQQVVQTRKLKAENGHTDR